MNRFFSLSMSMLALLTISGAALAQGKSSLSAFDQIKIAVQQICPVSGKQLGSMGDPHKVKIGQEELFLCCPGCTQGQVKKEHWETIHRNFATAQGICPVMEKPLPANPKATIVHGQIVYICCPPCTKKIQAEPKRYLTKLAGFYQNEIKTTGQPASLSRTSSDQISKSMSKLSEKDRLRAAVQKICPVSGNTLGATGPLHKVRVGKMEVFLCCEGCKSGKIDKQHWTTIAKNFKAAQAKCPVMEKDLPSNAKSTIVDGQLVFVCCPPCTKKIANEPAKYISKVNTYYTAFLSTGAVR